MTTSANNLTVLFLLPWTALWLAGGIWLARAAFRLQPYEEILVGIALGWVGQNWLANLLGQGLPVPLAFWAAAGIVFLGGGLAAGLRLGWKALGLIKSAGGFAWKIILPQMVTLAGIILVSFSIGRGTAIFDDFNHLPTASVMATGDIPPHFVLDPSVIFGYHHFLLLFSAQLIRVGGLMPWLAVDASRAISFGLAILLAGLFCQRMTRSLFGGLLGGVAIAFASGTRWLLLLVPPGILAWLGKSVQLIGSGAGSGSTLPAALVSSWAVEGSGPLPYPFAFANGIYTAGVIQAHNANGLTGFVIIFLLLLTCNRWRGGTGGLLAPAKLATSPEVPLTAPVRRGGYVGAGLSAILLSVWGLLGEAELPAFVAGFAIVALAGILTSRVKPLRCRLPRSLWAWLGVAAAGGLVGLLEGGAWTDILLKTLDRLSGNAASASYQTIGFQASFPPAVVSSHLGVLSLADPRALIVALFEMGPLLLVLPLMAAWGIKAFRLGRWFEAATAATAGVTLLAVFVQFAGSTGVRNTPRLYTFMPLLAAFAVPLAWLWTEHRSAMTRALVAGLGLVTVTGGLVMFGIELVAIQRPVYSYFITSLDARMTRAYWNRLDAGTIVFDPVPYRAPTVLGRPTDSNLTWDESKPAWIALRAAPDPVRLREAGFSYAYLDNGYWDKIPAQIQQKLSGGCVKAIGEVSDNQGNFRRLLDLRGCGP